MADWRRIYHTFHSHVEQCRQRQNAHYGADASVRNEETKPEKPGRLQKGLGRRREDANPSVGPARACPSAQLEKYDSPELMNDTRFRSEEPVLSITLDKVDGNFRRRQADLDVARARVSPAGEDA